jgi:hypothetical protein
MNPASESSTANTPGVAERHQALFTGLVLQQAGLASAFLGEAPNPETGRLEVNLEAASLFIDTLEMLEAKTCGNLSPDESRLLSETLTRLRLSFVQAANQPAQPPSATGAASASPASGQPAGAPGTPPAPAPEPSQAEEGGSGKRFVKRY